MPEMTGVELFSKLKAINPVPVRILITGYADINVVIRGLNEGLMWQYVTKPWDTEELKTLLRRAAQHYLKETQNDEPDPIRGLSF
jgi:response regulator RpfG family c-di-GMP phosphodiesterase